MAQYLYEHAGVPTDGTNGTYAHVAPPGALLIDTDNKTLYQNTNTQASPTWTERSASGGGSGLPLLIFASNHGGALNDTDPHDFVLDPATASVAVGAWTLNGDNDLVVPIAGWYEVIFSTQLSRTAGTESIVRMDINSATSDTDAGPVLVAVEASADGNVVDQDARSYTSYTAGQSTGKLQLTQTVAAAASAGTTARARIAIRCLALA
jgi:predicted transcriptional regulator